MTWQIVIEKGESKINGQKDHDCIELISNLFFYHYCPSFPKTVSLSCSVQSLRPVWGNPKVPSPVLPLGLGEFCCSFFTV